MSHNPESKSHTEIGHVKGCGGGALTLQQSVFLRPPSTNHFVIKRKIILKLKDPWYGWTYSYNQEILCPENANQLQLHHSCIWHRDSQAAILSICSRKVRQALDSSIYEYHLRKSYRCLR